MKRINVWNIGIGEDYQNSAFPGVRGKQETSLMFYVPVHIIIKRSNPSPNPP